MTEKTHIDQLFFIRELKSEERVKKVRGLVSDPNIEISSSWNEGCTGPGENCAGISCGCEVRCSANCAGPKSSLFSDVTFFSSKNLQDPTTFTLNTFDKLPDIIDCKNSNIYLQKIGDTDQCIVVDKSGVTQRVSLQKLGIDEKIIQDFFKQIENSKQTDKQLAHKLTNDIIVAIRQVVDAKAYSMLGNK